MESFLAVPLDIGAQLDVEFTIAPAMLTHHVPGRPGLLMTPTLVGLIEETCARLVRPHLNPGAAAVGTWVGVHHTGSATLGETLTVRATVTEFKGRRIRYAVTAQVAQRPVGHGEIGFTLVHFPAASSDEPVSTVDRL